MYDEGEKQAAREPIRLHSGFFSGVFRAPEFRIESLKVLEVQLELKAGESLECMNFRV